MVLFMGYLKLLMVVTGLLTYLCIFQVMFHNKQMVLQNAHYIGSVYQVEVGRDKKERTGYVAIYDEKTIEYISSQYEF